MTTKTHRADVLQGYINSGLSPVDAIKKLKTENLEYFPQHFDEQGRPLTFEGLVSRNNRDRGMRPDAAIRAATMEGGNLQREYYDRLRVGAVADMDRVEEGKLP